MRSLSRKSTSSPWPFWLLLLAWVCANTPPTATYTVLSWLGKAHSFSHQERLRSEVACLLAGKELPSLLVKSEKLPAMPSKPAIPPPNPLKKIDLAVEKLVDAPVPSLSSNDFVAMNLSGEGLRRAKPLHEPPRAADVS